MYEFGVGVAFCIWIGSLIWLFISLNSQLERNLNKVGSRQSWLSLQPKPMDNNHYHRTIPTKLGKLAVIFFLGFIGILFSWLYVAWYMGTIAYSYLKDAGAPQAIREFRWRMRNLDLSFDEIVEGMVLAAGNKHSAEHLKQQIWEEMNERGNA
jgi:hypothetical protein